MEEDALNDFQFHSATPGGHPKPVGEWESPAERQWSLSASGADTAEASNSPPCTAKGGMSEAFSRDASPPCEEMMTPPRCEMIAGLAANTPRYTPRYTPRVAVQHRLPPGEVSVLDGLDEARESSPFGECEGYFSRLQVHDSSLAMTVIHPTSPPRHCQPLLPSPHPSCLFPPRPFTPSFPPFPLLHLKPRCITPCPAHTRSYSPPDTINN